MIVHHPVSIVVFSLFAFVIGCVTGENSEAPWAARIVGGADADAGEYPFFGKISVSCLSANVLKWVAQDCIMFCTVQWSGCGASVIWYVDLKHL